MDPVIPRRVSSGPWWWCSCFHLCEWRPLGELDNQEQVSGKKEEEEED